MLLLALLLSGCGGGAASSAEEALPASSDAGSGVVTFQKTDVKNEAMPPTREEVLTAYDKAVTAFGWFRRQSLPCDQASVMVEGNLYRRVNYAGIQTMEELQTYLRGIFSQEVIGKLLPEDEEIPRYRDIDGKLYVLPISREPDPAKGTADIEVEQPGPDICRVNVTVELLSDDLQTVTGLEYYSFPYQCVDSRWVFTDFRLIDEGK